MGFEHPMHRRDLTEVPGNPAYELQKHYQELMAIPEVGETTRKATEIIKPFVGHGYSELNFNRFVRELNKSAERGIEGVRFYLTNYILKGSGQGVVGSRPMKPDEEGTWEKFAAPKVPEVAMRVGEAIESIASMTTEDINDKIVLTEEQEELKRLVESYGYHVVCEMTIDGGMDASISPKEIPVGIKDLDFVWITPSGNWLVKAASRTEAMDKIIKNRMEAGETQNEAMAHFEKNDDLIELDGYLEG